MCQIIKIPRTNYPRAFTGNTVILKSANAQYWGINLPNHWLSHAHVFLQIQGRMEETIPEPPHLYMNDEAKKIVDLQGSIHQGRTHFTKLLLRNTHANEIVMLDTVDILPHWLRAMYGYQDQEIDSHQLSLAFNQPEYVSGESAITYVETHYVPVRCDQELQLGDHLWLMGSNEEEKAKIPLDWYSFQLRQSAIYIAPNLVFVKEGKEIFYPFVLRDLASVYADYIDQKQQIQGNLKFWRNA